MNGYKGRKSVYYGTTTWRKKRMMRLDLSNHTCEECGTQGCELHVHHLKNDRFGGDELMSDLQVLCVYCHRDRHRKRENKQRRHLIGLQPRWV